MKPLTSIIIDDEPLARELIQHYLQDFPTVNVLTECGDGFSGLKAIQELLPDVVFLDIQMPKITGFELLELLEDPKPIIIFTTAYSEFALKAFELNAVDYLLKPFSNERFHQAIQKAMEALQSRNASQAQVKQLLNDPTHLGEEKLQRIVVKNGAKIHVLPIEEVIYLEAEDDYVMVHTTTGKYLKQQTMKYFESALDKWQFVRTHRSFILNVGFIAQIEHYEKESYQAILTTKAIVPISKSGYVTLKEVLGIFLCFSFGNTINRVKNGILQAIWIKKVKFQPLEPVDRAFLKENKGIVGNHNQGGKRQVTIIEKEKWEKVNHILGTNLDPSSRRANLMVSGLDLGNSKNKILTLGQVQILIMGETEPCKRMEEIQPGLQSALEPYWNGGVYGIVQNDGEIQLGDDVYFA